jgi:Leucine-rich repeat (LRR) protein
VKKILCILLLLPFVSNAQTPFAIPEPAFKACLVANYKHLLDANNDLIIEMADTTKEDIVCKSYDIVDATGIGFFHSTSVIDLSTNKITSINALGIDTLSQLKVLKLGTNQLSELPSLHKLTLLEELSAQSNFLSKLPDLSANTNLISLTVHTNRLTELPNLSTLSKLELLNYARNETIQKPVSLIGLTNLKMYYAWLSSMKTLPAIDHLKELVELNIGYNQLTVLPDLSANKKLSLIYANHNQLNQIPDFSQNTALTKVRLYNNYLTIDMIESVQNIPNFETIVPFAPQELLPINLVATQNELSDFYLKATDNYASSTMNITWYKNGVSIWSGAEDTFRLKNMSLQDEGKYSYSITTSIFPDLTLNSDTLNLKVSPCYLGKEFHFETSAAKCTNLGSLHLFKTNLVTQNITYTITDKLNNSYTTSDSFALKTNDYHISAQVENGCTIDLGDVFIAQEKCDDYFFSPNNDGIDDEFFFEQNGKIDIYNPWGAKVQSIEGPSYWDGKDSKGQLVPTGYYQFVHKASKKGQHLTVIH